MAAVELLEQDDAGELVGQRQRPEREAVVDLVELQAERTADDEAHVAAGLAALLEEARERQRVELLALARQQRDERALRESGRSTRSSWRTSIISTRAWRASIFR